MFALVIHFANQPTKVKGYENPFPGVKTGARFPYARAVARACSAIVLVFLAIAGGACGGGTSKAHVYVPVVLTHSSGLRYRPQRLIPAGDGSEILTKIRYETYGGTQAQATGTLLVDDCTPSCDEGKFHPVKAKLVFGKRAICQSKSVYTILEIEALAATRFDLKARRTVRLDYLAALCEPGQR